MTRSLYGCLILTLALSAGGVVGGAQAADTKEKLPKAKTEEKPAVVKPKPSPSEQAGSRSQSDRFIDKDNNGVDDRRETRVIRPEEKEAPPTVKQEKQPQPAPKPPAAKAPPGR